MSARLFQFKGMSAFALAAMVALLCSCRQASQDARASRQLPEPDRREAPTHRIDVSENVRRNLGITFAKVETRPVASTIRVPGQFELIPDARREHRTMLGGRVELLVRQFDSIEVGTPLYRLASPQWRSLQEKLSEADAAVQEAEARVALLPSLIESHQNHEASLRSAVEFCQKRVAVLEDTRSIGAVSANEFAAAHYALATQNALLAEATEKDAELRAQSVETQTRLTVARARFRLLLSTASMLLGVKEEELLESCDPTQSTPDSAHHHEGPASEPSPAWREIDEVEVRAGMSGVVQSVELTNGAWATEGSLVLISVDPTKLRFRALGMQSDLGRLKSGLPARVVPPKGGTIDLQDTMDATLTVGLSADPQERTIELIAVPQQLRDWARPGVSAHLEVILAGGQAELAIPLSSVIQDGLSKVFFRRDPKDPDKVIRTDADLGVNDGRWVVVHSGVKEGDEVVHDGIYQLMIASSGTAQTGGHFHPDGSFHAGEKN